MTALVIAIVLGANAWPAYEWRAVRIPENFFRNGDRDGRVARLALSADGTRAVVATLRGVVRVDAIGPQLKWQRDVLLEWLWDVGLLGEDRVVLSTGRKLIQLALEDGRVVASVPSRVTRFAPLRTRHIVGTLSPAPGELFFHAVISSEDGRPVFGIGEGMPDVMVVVADPSGMLFATGGLFSDLNVGSAHVRAIRCVTWGPPNVLQAAAFDAGGRYVAAAWGNGEVAVFDLLEAGRWQPHQAPGYIGKLRTHFPEGRFTGVGFLGADWVWFSLQRDVYCCQWRGDKAVRRLLLPGTAAFCYCKGSSDGHVLAALDGSGVLWFGTLAKPGVPR